MPFPNIRWLLGLITRLHRWVYLRSGGRVGHRMAGYRMLLLHNRGRKSGREFVTPLLYVEDGDTRIVVASNAGDDRAPAWWLNLRARPEASIQVGRERLAVRARAAGPEEEARLWPLLEASYPYYSDYRGRTDRRIPVVILDPA